MSASGPGCASASAASTDSGVLRKCARLETWVRARPTTSSLCWISELSSVASGSISVGNRPSSRRALPSRICASASLTRRSGCRPMRTCNRMATIRPPPSRRKDQNSVVLNSEIWRSTLRHIAGHHEGIVAIAALRGRQVHPPGHHPQILSFRAFGAAPGQRTLARFIEWHDLPVEQRARNLSAAGASPDLVIEAGIDAVEIVIEEAALQHHAAIGIGLRGRNEAVHVGGQRGIQGILRRHAERVGQHGAAHHQSQQRPDRRRRDQARGEGLKPQPACRPVSDLQESSQARAPSE